MHTNLKATQQQQRVTRGKAQRRIHDQNRQFRKQQINIATIRSFFYGVGSATQPKSQKEEYD